MYAYEFDEETGGLLLTDLPLAFSKEPRPVYFRELDILGFDRYWNYEKDDSAPYLWAEANNYFYRGRKVAQTRGGSCYTAPKLEILQEPEPDGAPLKFVDIPAMVEKNREILESLAQDTIKKTYNTYEKYRDRVDVFYVAFSGGKDSIVTLDIVQRALAHNAFKVLFGDTGMEFPDTYDVVDKVERACAEAGIDFLRAKSELSPEYTWRQFGPPSTTNRWCCSVHKTAPQVLALRKATGKMDFTGMAFTGVRAEESVSRSEYDMLSEGRKHQGQFSYHAILEWNSAEVFLYIFAKNLLLNQAYKRGMVRAGCLVCPNSLGKHEYLKRKSYTEKVDGYLGLIASTSGKTNYSESEMREFIDAGYWRTRRSGKELNLGQDKFEIDSTHGCTTIFAYTLELDWQTWAKTIGTITQSSDSEFSIEFLGKLYNINLQISENATEFKLANCSTTREDIRFQSLFKSAIIKSLYCIHCGVCEAECKKHCIDMKNGVHISDSCVHCLKCHSIREHCLRYGSIRNKITEGKKMAGLDRYYSFGIRSQWLQIYAKYEGGAEFWDSAGDGQVANKKKDAFLNFLKDSGIVTYNREIQGDKYSKCVPNQFAKTIFHLGAESSLSWALILVNLAYTPAFHWLIKNLALGTSYTPDMLKDMLSNVMDNDIKGLGKRNVVDSLKIFLCRTPLGTEKIFAEADVVEKSRNSASENISLISLRRTPWLTPEPRVILYSLYKFAEACGGYYQFTLKRLLNHEIDSEGVSPTEIFGLGREQMEQLLTGLSVNYPEFIDASFTHDLDNITLRDDKTSRDVLTLF